MTKLIMNSLDIRNFRGFKHLQIERLSRVNLISGKNNVGKSNLLEALRLYAYDGAPSLIWSMLRTRDEDQSNRRILEDVSLESVLLDLRYLFYGRKEIGLFHEPITIGPINSPEETLSISIGWYVRSVSEDDDLPRYQLLRPDEYDSADNPIPRFTIQTGKISKSYPIRTRPGSSSIEPGKYRTRIMIAPQGLDRAMVGALWNRVALTPLEKDVVEAMRIIVRWPTLSRFCWRIRAASITQWELRQQNESDE
jgi:AAA ATPase domain